MSLVDRYIVRIFLINTITLFVLLFGFVVTVDVVMNIGRFTRIASEIASEQGTESGIAEFFLTIRLVATTWWPRLLQLFGYLSGTVTIGAMGFTCAQLVRHREFVALLASGVSLHRLVRPFLLVALLFGAAQVIDQEVLIPRIAHRLDSDIHDPRTDRSSFRVRLLSDGAGGLLSAWRYDPSGPTLVKPAYWQRDSDGRVLRAVTAQSATWSEGQWHLEGGRMFVPMDGAGVTEDADTLAIALDPQRIELSHLQTLGQSLSWRQISTLIREGGLDRQAVLRLERARWGRVAGVFSNILALLAALPFFLVRMPRPMLVPALKSAPVAIVGLAAAGVAGTGALAGLPVWLGAFLPALVLVPITIALITGIRS